MRMRSPTVGLASRSSRSHTACDSPAPANMKAWTRLNSVSRSTSSFSIAVDELLEALGHVEIDRRRDLAQVAQRLRHSLRRRLAVVDVERAAVVEADADVLVAAEGVVPRQPVDQHRRLVGSGKPGTAPASAGCAQHAVRVRHALGRLGGARREQQLDDGVRARRGMGAARASGPAGWPAALEADGVAARERAFGQHDSARLAAPPRVSPVHKPACAAKTSAGGRHGPDVAQLGVILATAASRPARSAR